MANYVNKSVFCEKNKPRADYQSYHCFEKQGKSPKTVYEGIQQGTPGIPVVMWVR
jgi:hypothetical protein